jgi:hypothetical protein
MLIRIFACLWALLCACLAGADGAGSLPVPTVAYCADRVIVSVAGTFNGRVCAADGRERTEMSFNGMSSVMIVRPDLKLGWMLMPTQKMYQEMELAKARQQSGGAPADDVKITEVGAEDVEGVAATKYKVLLKDGSAGGFMWFTAQGIPVKMDLLQKSGGKSERMTMTLKNLQVGPQDAATFEVPAGYAKMPSFGAGGMFGGAKKMLGFGR